MSEFEKRFPEPKNSDYPNTFYNHWNGQREGWLEALKWVESLKDDDISTAERKLEDEIEELENDPT